MILHGGNIRQTYTHPETHEEIDLITIAKGFNAQNVANLLNRL